jgi:hypothetical protein
MNESRPLLLFLVAAIPDDAWYCGEQHIGIPDPSILPQEWRWNDEFLIHLSLLEKGGIETAAPYPSGPFSIHSSTL